MRQRYYLKDKCEHRFKTANSHGVYVCGDMRILCRDGWQKAGCKFYKATCPTCGRLLE